MSEVNQIVYSLLWKLVALLIQHFGACLAARDEEHGEIAGPEGRGAAGGGWSASRAGSQAKFCHFQSQETYSGS